MSRWKRRCCMTHVGLICDQTHIQPRVPQVIIGSEATLPTKSMTSLRAACPPTVILLRRRSAWSNRAPCAWIAKQLAHALAPYSARFQPVLLMDASRIHVASVVLRACHRAGVWVVLVPARLAWLMQPLDTHTASNVTRRICGASTKTHDVAALATATWPLVSSCRAYTAR